VLRKLFDLVELANCIPRYCMYIHVMLDVTCMYRQLRVFRTYSPST